MWPTLAVVGILATTALLTFAGFQTYRLSESRRIQQELEKSSQALQEERKVLELIAKGASLKEVLDALTVAIERLAPQCFCTILLLDANGRRLVEGSGGSLPSEYIRAVNGLEIGPNAGACGTAAFRNETTIVEDVATDFRFATAKDLLLSFGLRACWSVPIRGSNKNVLGTFAMYHQHIARPREYELNLVEAGAHLAGNAIERLRFEQNLRESASRFQLAEKAAAFGVWQIDFRSGMVTISDGFSALAGLVGWPLRVTLDQWRELIHVDDRPAWDAVVAGLAAEQTFQAEYRILRPDGSIRWLRSQAHTELSDGGLHMLTGASIDITEPKGLLMRFSKAFNVNPSPMIINTVSDGRYVDVNDSFLRVTGYQREEVLGHTAWETKLWNQAEDRVRYLEMLEETGSVRDLELIFRTKTGTQRTGSISAELIDIGGEKCAIAVLKDITERKAAEEQVRHLAYYDALTGLANRTLLRDRIAKATASALRRGERVALLFLDLDRFKVINDSLGHSVGDLLLKEVAQRLKKWARAQDTVARIGGDEFVIMLASVKDVPDAVVVAKRIMGVMSSEFVIQGRAFDVSCSIGISIYPEHGTDAESLVKNADAAMYSAKEAGRNTVRFFTDEMNAQVMERLTLEHNLRLALDRKELFLLYQPQMDVTTGEITGFEALIRWQHPELGLVSPDKFIHVAENSGLIVAIGEWVLRTACHQARQWQADGLLAVPVAVNVSALQIRQEHFGELIKRVLRDTGLEAEYLQLELTESVLLSNADLTFSVVQDLKSMGIKLAIDDFGTGYSSLSYLRRFPVNKLKIDRSFVKNIGVDQDDGVIAAAIIGLAKSLNLRVIAEGVENEEQMSFLRQHHCDEIQGYYFSRPLPADEAAHKLGAAAAELVQQTPAQRGDGRDLQRY